MDTEGSDPHLDRADSIANRDEPIPILRIPSREEAIDIPASSDIESEPQPGKSRKRERFKDGVDKIKDTVGTQFSSPTFKQNLGDRLVGNILTYVIPSDAIDATSDEEGRPDKKKDRRSRTYVDRPNFSVGQMSANFRRFNARIGIVFVLQARMIYLFSWKNPTATLSFLAVYSLLCLNPHLVPLVPLVLLLFYIMIPSFMARHPVPKNDPRLEPSYHGPAMAPASRVKPAPDLSKDFMRNMRDLQNCMEDFSRVHDAANEYITPYTNFSDEKLSSSVFLFFFVLSGAAFIGSSLVPWRFIALASGWLVTAMGHSDLQAIILSSRNIRQVRTVADEASTIWRNWIEADVILDEPPERRQVEIFELQKHHPMSGTWEAWLFSPNPFDPLSPLRIAGARPKGTQFFEDVQPPTGWAWKDKKWTLDLASREWIMARMITGVEVETEGERWVYDLAEEEVEKVVASSPRKGKGRREVPVSGWEESLALSDRTRGEWRRRRWIRVVERKAVSGGKKVG